MIGAFVQINLDSKLWRSRPVGYLIEPTGCWSFVGHKDEKGYGRYRNRPAHRYLYEQVNGPVPDGLVLDHFACDNPSCVNPAHVRPVTSRENTLRSDRTLASQQLARTHCVNGHPLSGSNLRPSKEGRRRCRICKNASEKRRANANRRAAGIPVGRWPARGPA